jgi:hypothetical protein
MQHPRVASVEMQAPEGVVILSVSGWRLLSIDDSKDSSVKLDSTVTGFLRQGQIEKPVF